MIVSGPVTHHARPQREYIYFTRVPSADSFLHYVCSVTISNRLSHVSRRGRYWHVLSKQRSCPLIAGFSSVQAWVTQPCRLHSPWEQANPKANEEAFNICCLYKRIRIPSSSSHAFSLSLPSQPRAPAPKFQSSFHPRNHVRIRWSGQVDGLLRHGGGHY